MFVCDLKLLQKTPVIYLIQSGMVLEGTQGQNMRLVFKVQFNYFNLIFSTPFCVLVGHHIFVDLHHCNILLKQQLRGICRKTEVSQIALIFYIKSEDNLISVNYHFILQVFNLFKLSPGCYFCNLHRT